MGTGHPRNNKSEEEAFMIPNGCLGERHRRNKKVTYSCSTSWPRRCRFFRGETRIDECSTSS